MFILTFCWGEKSDFFFPFIIGKELKNQLIIAFPVEVSAAKGHLAEG